MELERQGSALIVLNAREGRTVAAVFERLFPADEVIALLRERTGPLQVLMPTVASVRGADGAPSGVFVMPWAKVGPAASLRARSSASASTGRSTSST